MLRNFIRQQALNNKVELGMNHVKKVRSSSSVKPKTLPKMSCVILFAATLMLITSPFVLNEAFATHLSEELKWQLVFISSSPACSNYHYQMTNKYFDVSLQYLDAYQVNHMSYDPLCIPESKYFSEYESPHDLDLIILVYDRNLGEKELHEYKMGGLYSHTGMDRTQNHAIIFCDCSSFDFSNPVWILSHELSHFVLYYNDYEMQVIEDVIHVNDNKYDQCFVTWTSKCSSISLKLQSDNGQIYSVMPIYEPAIDADTVNNQQVTEFVSTEVVLDLTQMITKWWATGKITDGDYANAIGFIAESDVISSHKDKEIMMADDPLDSSVTWEDMMKEITPKYWAHTQVDDDKTKPLSRIPENLINQNDEVFKKETVLGLPDWFKTTAAWWAQEKITDKEFKKNVEYLVKAGIINPQNEIFQELAKSNHPSTDANQDSVDDIADSTQELANDENLNADSNQN